jgi:hypothetical protein
MTELYGLKDVLDAERFIFQREEIRSYRGKVDTLVRCSCRFEITNVARASIPLLVAEHRALGHHAVGYMKPVKP